MAIKPKAHTQEDSQAELSTTEISPATARFLSWSFVAILIAVPVIQAGAELSRGSSPQAFALFRPVAAGFHLAFGGHWPEATRALFPLLTKEYLDSYQNELENGSLAKAFVQPRLQGFLTGALRFGNEKVVVGTGDWLYYTPGVDYLTGLDFLDPDRLRARTKRMVDHNIDADPHPDPRPAILDLNEQCRRDGTRLVVMPAPDKSMLQPWQLRTATGALRSGPPPNNPGYPRLVSELRAQGVDVVDPSPPSINPDEIRFLEQDTHWTPEFMDLAARRMAGHVREILGNPAPTLHTRLEPAQVSRVGDLVDMLKLSPDQRLFQPAPATIQRVVDDRTGVPIHSDPSADVLLLGDSYTNIFSQGAMGWGENAGFGEHLAHHLGRPVHVIALNGAGAWKARAELARSETGSNSAFKRVIVWQFAIRDLAVESWKLVPLPPQKPVPPAAGDAGSKTHEAGPSVAPPEVSATRPAVEDIVTAPPPSAPTPPSAAGPVVIVARVVKISNVPKPGTAPYKDCLTFIKLAVEKVEQGAYTEPEIIGAFIAMRDNVWLPAASYQPGERLRLQIVPMKEADPEIQKMQRADDTDDFTLQPQFVQKQERL